MMGTSPGDQRLWFPRGAGLTPSTIQRIEGGLVAVLALAGTVMIEAGLWWFPLALFLVFDMSMAGYLRSPSAGAFWYNVVHTYAWPLILALIALSTSEASRGLSRWLALVALAWALHVGVDRMLGYGLKLPDAFTATHLGRIGKNQTGMRHPV